jgi:uncharacterized membrane protein YhdT
MIDVVSIVQVKAFARQSGVFLALLWLASFAAMMYAPQSPWGSLLAITTPFLVGWLLKRFRDGALEGRISFRRSFAFSVLTFFYASMIFALGQYVYFRFLDHGAFLTNLLNDIKVIKEAYAQNGMSVKELEDGATLVGALSPIQLAFMFMMQNIFVGFVLSVPVALVCKKKQK